MDQLALFNIAPTIDGIDARQVNAAYSADLIGTVSTVRKPVLHAGVLWVNVGGSMQGQEVYRLVPLDQFDGEATTYNLKSGYWREGDAYPGDYARSDPNGFYHGMTVKHGRASYVMVGPPQHVDCSDVRDLDLDLEDEPEEDEGGVYDDDADGGRSRIGDTWEDEEEEDEDGDAAA